MIHWSWIFFFAVVIAIVGRLIYNRKTISGDYSWDIESFVLWIVLFCFILIWGGIFWW